MPRDRDVGHNLQIRATEHVPTRGTIPTAKPPAATFPYSKAHPCRKRQFCNLLKKGILGKSANRACCFATVKYNVFVPIQRGTF
jgi:hypothetical protein